MNELLESARHGVSRYLASALANGHLDQQLHDLAMDEVIRNLEEWLEDPELDRISPHLKAGVRQAIQKEQWKDIVNAYRQRIRFGTGGIRGLMAFYRDSIVQMKEGTHGIDEPILKGPNTINNVVFLLTSVGVAQFGKQQSPPFEKVVIGYDSRIRGGDFARQIAELFLAFDYTVCFFDEPCPYPEVTFAIPNVKADVGIFISASHNDYRYNGYKFSSSNGSQFDEEQRNDMYEKYIVPARSEHIQLKSFSEASAGQLVFLGGPEPVPDFDYGGHEATLIDMHKRHCDHVQTFLLTANLASQQKQAQDPLRIGYCAYHGAGRKAVPRLLRDVGFVDVNPIHVRGLNDLNGLFPCFSSEAGAEEQPDPGDSKAADIAVAAFKEEYGEKFNDIDILIGTDPDADRCGVTVKVPQAQQHLFDGKSHMLLPADDMWALVMWYRLQREVEKYGQISEPEKKFVVLSHTTCDSVVRLARKHGLGVIKTWVGFAALAAAVRDTWEGKSLKQLTDGRMHVSDRTCDSFVCEHFGMDSNRSINVAAMEQSNGFSILGGPPPDARSLGEGGHVRDKDGTLAALLVAEIAAWAKAQGTTLFELIDEKIYLDPDVGLFVNCYEPDPLMGEYPGIEGDRIKLAILRRSLAYFQLAMAGDLEIAGMPVKAATIYRTGKYDKNYPPTFDFEFPDEGVRFFFDEQKMNHLTVRPSGTGNSLRFHVQLRANVTRDNLIREKARLRDQAERCIDDIRTMLRAPRQ